ncbi:hypothetical protein EK599_15115 [Vibrio sp. T187]|uniref:hypothetical protein n=1 Tax=Vibrio TaxID=662 RepID=UPI0010CA1D07|nr:MULTISPECIES: hypothetical protein [Vibrio]MBW3697030.1 hypothetical protein [Vibrio sp. T187]
MAQSYAIDCPAGQVDQGGVCVSSCMVFKDLNRTVRWDAYVYGDEPNRYCRGSAEGQVACELILTGAVQVDAPNNDQYWTGQFKHTGATCAWSERGRFFGDEPLPFPYEGDLNMNGIPDIEEDFDGDGIPNGVDPAPNVNNSDNADNSGNNIPDALDPHVNTLNRIEDVNYVIECSGGVDCNGIRTLANSSVKVADTNSRLATSIQKLAIDLVDKDDLRAVTRGVVGAIEDASDTAVNTIHNSRVMTTEQIDGVEANLYNRIVKSENNVIGAMNGIEVSGGGLTTAQNSWLLDSVRNSVTNKQKNDQIISTQNTHSSRLNQIEMNLANKIEDISISGGGGLTSTQATQLKNAANRSNGAKKNTDTIKNQMSEALDVLNRNYRNSDKLDALAEDVRIAKNNSSLAYAVSDDTFYEVQDLNESLSAQIEGLATKLDGLASGGSPTDGNGSQIIADSLSGISDSIDKLGQGTFTKPTPGDTFQSDFLFSESAFTEINTDIETLKTEYAAQLNEFKSLLSVDVSGFEQGEYVEHRLDLTLNGGSHSFKSGVLEALLDNSELIYAVIIFICVIAGLRMLGNS